MNNNLEVTAREFFDILGFELDPFNAAYDEYGWNENGFGRLYTSGKASMIEELQALAFFRRFGR